MTSEIQQKYESLAEQIGAHAAQIPGITLVTLMGSVAAGIADEYSDIDLLAFYVTEPSTEAIHTALNGENSQTKAEKFWLDADKFSMQLSVDGILAAVVFMKQSWYEGRLAEYPNINLEQYKQLAFCVSDARFIAGNKDLYESWKAAIGTMPSDLKKLTLHANVSALRNFFVQKRILPNEKRGDWLFVNSLFAKAVDWVLETIFIFNNFVYSSPKLARRKLSGMKVKPANLIDRLEEVVVGENTEKSLQHRMSIMAEIAQELEVMIKQ